MSVFLTHIDPHIHMIYLSVSGPAKLSVELLNDCKV
nr:hypothetical protein KV8917_400051 [Klebsiella variicola]